ncbi:MAG: BrnT family toxin [Pseudomonadota bacterium]
MQFEWDNKKDLENQLKHNISFTTATKAFSDDYVVIADDPKHSLEELRFFCYGKVDGVVMTVRFTYRNEKVRIFGAAYWREGTKIYAKKNNI